MLIPQPKIDDNIILQTRHNSAEIGDVNDIIMQLSGLQHWCPVEQQKAKSLNTEYACIFAIHGIDLENISMLKNNIKLTDYMPFKKGY